MVLFLHADFQDLVMQFKKGLLFNHTYPAKTFTILDDELNELQLIVRIELKIVIILYYY